MTNEPETTTVRAPIGEVRGRVDESGVRRFLGIPYAEPPLGERRFRPPVPRAPFAEVYDAADYGPTAPQLDGSGAFGEILPNRVAPGEDYLNLNVWAPPDGSAHAVMVFIHGGGWWSGSGSVSAYDGARFAQDGVVLVTINYRLGAEGMVWFGDGPANISLLDQICALQWVHDNIAAFGGDPEQVTVFGESSGGMSIGALLAMPAARGLFRRAIMQSGSTFHSISAGSAHKVATALARMLHVNPSLEAIGRAPSEDVLAAQRQLLAAVQRTPLKSRWGDVARNGLPFEPIVDGASLPGRPIDAVAMGAAAEVELLVGWNAEETRLALAPSGVDKVRWSLFWLLAIKSHVPLRVARAYRKAYSHPADAAVAMTTDWIYRIPAIRTAEAHGHSYLYEFAWRSPAFGGELGACHAAELPFVFDNLDDPGWRMLLGDAASPALAREMHDAWIRFARTGDPGWAPYAADARQVRRFDTKSATLDDPDRATRIPWDGVR
ncbi:MAG TPA: carboxylesterase family protein [Lacisediminihabitans sp.]|uniref:carboxylesterase/lipase family protein n=1 Tax=Lacisediminihabitans sp. TaxID=2787631 RepID=UPI002EDA45A5